MAQKIVSFEVAKALKEAGYPQTTRPIHCYNEKGQLLGRGGNYIRGVKYDAPTYLDAWLWLWREKGTPIQVDYAFWGNDVQIDDPEEFIAKVIDFLVENKKIK